MTRAGLTLIGLAALIAALGGCGGDDDSPSGGGDTADRTTAPSAADDQLAGQAELELVARLGLREAARIAKVKPGEESGDVVVVVRGLGKSDAPIARTICRTLRNPVTRSLDVGEIQTVGPSGQMLVVRACRE